MPIASAWDGSYAEVERYLKRVANDPDSIDVDDLICAIEQIMGPSNAFGKVNHAAFYLDPVQIMNFTPGDVIQLLAATGNALAGLGYRGDFNTGIAVANRVLGH